MLAHESARNMVLNSDFCLLHKQSALDRKSWADLLALSDTEEGFIDDSIKAGEGMLVAGGVRVPIRDDFPKGVHLRHLEHQGSGDRGAQAQRGVRAQLEGGQRGIWKRIQQASSEERVTEPAYSQSGGGTMRSVVGKEKATALTTGSVKDSASQSLSTLSEHESAAGERKSAASTKAPRNAKAKSAGTNCPSDARASAKADSKGKARAARQAAEAKGLPAKQAEQPSKRTLSPMSAIASGAIHETDDTPEFEGVGGAYDKAAVTKRVFLSTGRAKEAKGKTARATARSAKKSRGAAGTPKAATSRTASAKGVLGVTASAGRTAQAASASAAVAERAATTKTLGAAASSALAPIAGIVAGIIAFVLGVLVVSNIVSALFGFWENEANKQAMEELPPYITYEMVEAALECQETYGHPAGCTLAQIICESGQGDHIEPARHPRQEPVRHQVGVVFRSMP